MAGTLEFAAFAKRVLRRLNEAANSPLGEVPSGTGATPSLTSAQAIADAATEGAQRLARTCYPLRGAFTYDVAGGLPGRLDDFAVDAAPSGARLWRALREGVAYTPDEVDAVATPLRWAAPWALAANDRGYRTQAATEGATVSHWTEEGEALAVWRVPTDGTLTVQGLYLPPPANTTEDQPMFAMLPDAVTGTVIEAFVCGWLAAKNADDPGLASRVGLWMGEWMEGCERLLSGVSPDLRAYLAPIAAMGAEG